MPSKSMLPILIVVNLFFLTHYADAGTRRAREVPMENSGDGNPGDRSGSYSDGPASLAVKSATGREANLLAQAAGNGAGRLNPDTGAMCFKGVKQIVADAFGKDLNCVRGHLGAVSGGGSAKSAGQDLQRAGFVNKYPGDECWRQGTIRVYGGKHIAPYARTAGDTHGHIEVVTDDGRFCSDFCKDQPIDKWMSAGHLRRPLKGCWVMPSGGLERSPIRNCPNRGRPADGRVGGGVN